MLGGFIGGLIVAWILNLFGVGSMIIEVVQPHVETVLTNNHYFVGMGLVGMLSGLFVRN